MEARRTRRRAVKVALGADHRGFALKERIKALLRALSHEAIDVGTRGEESVDYPDYAIAAAEMVSRGEADRGILICGSGAGMSIAANKVPGVRAALAVTPEGARLARAHNDANVLTLGAWQEDDADRVLEIVKTFLATDFEGGRHARRVDKIRAYEEKKERS
jgi:RpiB/LacA/LacB family sugar-phosphate isomerase